MKKIIDLCNYNSIIDFMIKHEATSQEITEEINQIIKTNKIIIK